MPSTMETLLSRPEAQSEAPALARLILHPGDSSCSPKRPSNMQGAGYQEPSNQISSPHFFLSGSSMKGARGACMVALCPHCLSGRKLEVPPGFKRPQL